MDMNTTAVHNLSDIQEQHKQLDPKTEEACRQFEGLLLGMILRQSLASSESGEEQPAGASLMKEFASEQLAQSLSESGGIGIADMLRLQLNNTGKSKL